LIDQAEIHRKSKSIRVKKRKEAIEQLDHNFAVLPDKEAAWQDLIRLTRDKDRDVRCGAAGLLDAAFPHLSGDYRAQAWQDLLQFEDRYVRGLATVLLGTAFPHLPEAHREQAWQDLIQLTGDKERPVRMGAARSLGTAFPHLPEAHRGQAWADLHRLTEDEDIPVRYGATLALGAAYPHLPEDYRAQAWADLHRLTEDEIMDVRWGAAASLGAAFPHLSEAHRAQAWTDLIRLTGDKQEPVRWGAAASLGAAFPHLSEAHRAQARADLIRLTGDEHADVRLYANHALGKVSVLKATETDSEDEFKKELETALAFFDAASQELTDFNPARFCSLFYHSYYAITFQRSAEDEVQRYLIEAKRAAEGSESKKKLLEAVENLADALKEVQDLRGMDFDVIKRDLNAYRRYCDRAAELLEVTEEQAPGATRLIRRGLPIIDQRIKEILEEIQEKTAEVCRHAKGTSLEPLGYEINQIGKNLLLIRDPIGLEKGVENLLSVVSDICDKMPGEERGEACELLKKAKAETYIEDRIDLINIVLGKIPAQIRMIGLEKKIDASIIFLKPGIREELTVTVGAEVFGTGVQHVITIPLQEISYPELKEDLAKIKEKSTIKLASLPQRLAHKVKDYLIKTKKEDLLKQLR
jgi:HEAT repeat protein